MPVTRADWFVRLFLVWWRLMGVLRFLRPAILPILRSFQWAAYALSAVLGLIQAYLTVRDSLCAMFDGLPATVYGAMLGESEVLSAVGLMALLVYWSPQAFSALFFCYGRMLQLAADWLKRADLEPRFSLL